jgi:hypothetical protein
MELTGKMPVPLRFRLTPERFKPKVKNRVKMRPSDWVHLNIVLQFLMLARIPLGSNRRDVWAAGYSSFG